MHRWLLRATLLMLLLVAYVGIWGDHGRQAYIQHVAGPLLSQASSVAPGFSASSASSDGPYRVQMRLASKTVGIVDARGPDRRGNTRHDAPGGVRFLLPALFLVVLAPTRRYWISLWVAHVGLAGLELLALGMGLSVHDVGFVVHRFLAQYAVDVLSLGFATLAFVHERAQPLGSPFSS